MKNNTKKNAGLFDFGGYAGRVTLDALTEVSNAKQWKAWQSLAPWERQAVEECAHWLDSICSWSYPTRDRVRDIMIAKRLLYCWLDGKEYCERHA